MIMRLLLSLSRAPSMITTILSCVATQRAIDYLVTSYLRLKRRKQRAQGARAAFKNAPRVCVINTAKDVAKRKMLEAKKAQRKRSRAKAKAAEAAIVNNKSNL
ncbi:MAG: hypothetical protein HCTETUND2_055 [Candidatus Hodgkinia cicadicola]|nr:MAG: hypothetical protein HCTETUND2_055 [Candidatus Hodgkinia cicadicola]